MLYVNLFALLLTQQLLASIESAVIPVLDNVTRNSSGVGMSFEEEMVDTYATSLGYGYNDSVMMLPWPETISVNEYYNETQTQAEKQLFHTLTNETEPLTTSSSEEVLSESAYETTNNGTEDEDSLVNEEDQTEQLTEVTELQSSLTRNISVSEDSSYESSTNSAQNQTEHLTTSFEEERLSESAYETKNNGSDDGISLLKENQVWFHHCATIRTASPLYASTLYSKSECVVVSMCSGVLAFIEMKLRDPS
ncbi:unnamed protein product [Dicrocoelium dendriticum]|nr:unnamed protein product [Dicrocoelium dendriticum]